MLPSSLQISIVTYRPDAKLLERCLRKLALAIGAAREDGALRTVHLALIDNSEDRDDRRRACIKLGKTRFSDSGVHVTYLHGHANIGYGAAHNLVLHGTGSDYHLVLNPDVELATDALANAVRWLDAHPDVGALAPLVLRSGRHARIPVQALSGGVRSVPARLRAAACCARCFAGGSTRYEMRDVIDVEPPRDVIGIPALSGAFMLVQRAAIDSTGGFDPKFFLYFEDFDWSVRLNRDHQDRVRAVGADRPPRRRRRAQGLQHICWFVTSGLRFYRKHGWKWF